MEMNMTSVELFHKVEKEVADYDQYINRDHEHCLATLATLDQLVQQIQRESLFSSNEELRDIATDNLKLLMVPYLEAEVLMHMMDDRYERVLKAHTYYLEYLKLMKHYFLLEKHQEVRFKDFLKRHTDALKNIETEERDERDPKSKMLLLAQSMDDRDTKIANYKFKKTLEQNLDRLKDYKDESMKRDFYKCQIQLSIMCSLDQLTMTEMELNVLCHQASLSYEQRRENEIKSSQTESGTLKVVKLQPEDVPKIPSMFPTCEAHSGGMMQQMQEPQYEEVVHRYVDPLTRKVDRVFIQNDNINDRMGLKTQYQQQVFQAGHTLPTMSIEELADMEVEDALAREAQQKQMEAMREAEDSDDEQVQERERQKTSEFDDWKDWNPKGRGNTKRM